MSAASRSRRLQDILPLSPLQEGLLFHALYDEADSDVYTVQLVLHAEGELDPDAFVAAAEALLQRHPNLRAGFRYSGSGKAAQLIPDRVEVPVERVDLRGTPMAEREAALAGLLAADRARRFDLSTPPALRFTLVRYGPDEHRIVLTGHHILLDGWSTPLLVRDLLVLYAQRGDPSGLPPVAPYRDYLGWLLSQDRESAEAAWREALHDLEAPTRLARRARAAVTGPPPAPERVERRLSERLTERLTAFARGSGLTLNTVLQGVWAILLSRLTGGQDVVFGATVAARPPDVPGIESMVGLLINTVPVRVRLRTEEPLRDALVRIQDEQARLLTSRHLGLAHIQRIVGLGELFDTLTVFENYPRPERLPEVPGVRITGMQARDATHYPLTLVVTPGPRLLLELSYRPDVFEASEVSSMADRLERLLESAVSDPTRPVGRIDVLSEDERARLLALGTGPDARTGSRADAGTDPETDTDRKGDDTGTIPAACFDELFARQVARTPDAPAVVLEDTRLSYAELDAQAERLAERLVARGVGPERLVGLLLPRSIAAVVAIVAVQKAQGAHLPLDPAYPPDRIAGMLADADPVLVIATSALAERLGRNVPTLILDDPAAAASPGYEASPEAAPPAGADTSAAPPAASATSPTDDLERAAYVIYTSGSTGRPKGVVITHRGLASLVATAVQRLGVGPDSRISQFASLSFDVAFWELSMSLLTGACLVVVPEECRRNGEALAAYAVRHRLTHLVIPPSLLSVIPPTCEFPEGLTFLVGSEAVPGELVRRWSEKYRVVVAYGVTEATVNSTLWSGDATGLTGPAPIGRPDPGTRAYVLDAGLLLAPEGVPGELYLAGDGLAREYLHRPDLTAERFLPDPYGPPGGRMYRTGDVVRWSADGNLEFLGRADDQINLRGFRIEPGEIESVLLGHPAVAQAAVVARPGPSGAPWLVAYVVPTEDAAADAASADTASATVPLDTASLRAHAARLLPDHMVPGAFVTLPALPLTPNGKLDRAALPEPDRDPSGGRRPETDAERVLAELFSEVLNVPDVRVEDDFFALGGDSILSIQLVSRARRAGLRLSPREVFEHKTIEALARVARPVHGRTEDREHDDGLGEVPLTPIMRWLQEQGGPVDGHNQAVVVQVPAVVDRERLCAVLQALLDHHAMLRARLTRDGGTWRLEVRPPGTVRAADCLTRVDVSGLSEQELDAALAEQERSARSRLAPESGGMVQVVWCDAGPSRPARLVFVVHHLAVDGVSWRILLPDAASAWEAVRDGRPVRLEPVGTSFRRWARLLEQEARRPAREAELALWERTLREGERDALPTERPLDPARDVAATTRHLLRILPPERTRPLLTTVTSAFHCGVNDVLLTALALAVRRWRRDQGEADGAGLLINLEGHGREELGDVDLSRTVGWFTSTYPVRLDLGGLDLDDALAGGPAAGTALKTVKEQLRAVPDNGLGYGLLRYLNPRTGRVLAALPEPLLGFNYLGRFPVAESDDPGAWAPAGRGFGGSADPGMPAAYVLEINALTKDRPEGPELSASWSWPDGVLREEAVAALAEGWFDALDALVEHAEKPGAGGYTPSDLPYITLTQDDIAEFEEEFGA